MSEALRWPRWSRDMSPATLAQYVQTGVIGRLLAVPRTAGELDDAPPRVSLLGPGGGPALARLRAAYDALLGAQITYDVEAAGSEPGRQVIRPPDEVLVAPRQATCLDLAVTYAGACLDAGLHPLVAVLDSATGGASHALVVVWLGSGEDGDENWTDGRGAYGYPLRGEPALHPRIPAAVVAGLRTDIDDGGEFVAIDVTRVADGRETFEQALKAGAALLAGQRYTWALGVDVATGFRGADRLRFDDGVDDNPLVAAYSSPAGRRAGPLERLRARTGQARFRDRDELDLLLDWCQTPPETGRHVTQVAIVTGPGGCGKTHLAAELCARLDAERWFTGFLTRQPTAEGLKWLAGTVSPLLVIVDYAETAADTLEALLRELGRRRHAPTYVVLTARNAIDPDSEGGWWADVAANLNRDDVPFQVMLPIELPELHPHPGGVFRRALEVFAAPADPPDRDWRELPEQRWTTLDYVLHAWLAVDDAASPTPQSRTDLYERVIQRELRYWRDTITERYGKSALPSVNLLRRAAACVSLLTPAASRLPAVLTAVAFSDDRRDQVAAVCADVLPPDADGTIAVRPDPIADYLLLQTFGADHELLAACTRLAQEDELVNLCTTLSRAADTGLGGDAGPLAKVVLGTDPVRLWQPTLAVGAALGGPMLAAIEELAAQPETPLPIAELAADIPASHVRLMRLALIATEQLRPAAGHDPQARAAWLSAVSVRRDGTGDRAGALTAGAEAAGLYRELAGASPETFLPELATALNNLSIYQQENGDRAGGLASVAEAVAIRRDLARSDPAQLPHLAVTLNNLANHQSNNGDRSGALATITEAVGHYRELAHTDSAAFLPNLALTLSNLSVYEGNNGDRSGALATITEAVGIYRELARTNPAAHLPNLGMTLNNLSNHQRTNGDRVHALATVTEAVGIYRELARTNPAAFLPNLALTLNNLSICQGNCGDRASALATGTEAASIYRELARTNPATFLPNLATTLNNLSSRQSETGDRASALTTITEATGLYRELARTNPAAFLADLAMTLNNLANQESNHGDRSGALATITEAVGLYRELARTNPATFLPDLAMALNNLSSCQSETGDRASALTTVTEATDLYRELARANPATFLPDLAGALNNLSSCQNLNGDRIGALATVTDAVGIYRELARANPAAFLPDLAMVLNNLSVHQHDNGDSTGALATITEAVGIRRQLAHTNPAFRPDLAVALNNMSNHQSDNGDHRGALTTITEATDLYRELARANPAAFLPDLAMTLNNLSNRQSGIGDSTDALATITEAADVYRELARANPAAFLPYLAASLNNLAICLGGNDDRAGALSAITETVGLYRELARASRATFLPDLAMALNNLSIRQGHSGDGTGALTTITEAVGLYRELARASRATFLPDLAMALNNLSIRQGHSGDGTGALTTITEAVGLYRELARTNPATYLSKLAGSLLSLADRLADGGDAEAAIRSYRPAIEDLRPGAAAELLASRALWRHGRQDTDGAVADLGTAAQLADEETEWLGRARRTVNRAQRQIRAPENAGLPVWAYYDLPEVVVATVDAWIGAESWAQREALIREVLSDPGGVGGEHGLEHAAALFPEVPAIADLQAALADVAAQGLAGFLDAAREADAHAALLRAWLDTPTWSESLRFARAHPSLLTDARTIDTLQGMDPEDPVVRQHVAIVWLAIDQVPLPEIYDLLTDAASAAVTAVRAVDGDDIDRIAVLFMLCPQLAGQPFFGAYLLALLAALRHAPDGDEAVVMARTAMTEAAKAATAVQRQTGVSRLRRVLARHPEESPLLSELIDMLAEPPS